MLSRFILLCAVIPLTTPLWSSTQAVGLQPHDDTIAARAAPGNSAQAADVHWWDGFGSAQERGFDRVVTAFAEYRGELIAAGNFLESGGRVLRHIARWDGASWQPLEAGIDDWAFSRARVNALAVHDSCLIAGGSFPSVDGGLEAENIAIWDGSGWYAINGSLNGEVLALVVHEGDLIVGGEFVLAGTKYVNHVARWDGSAWWRLGLGLDQPVGTLAVHEGTLFAGGGFSTSGGDTVGAIAWWDGAAWRDAGSNVEWYGRVFTSFAGNLVASGTLLTPEGPLVETMLLWDGGVWTRISPPVFTPRDAVVYKDRLVATGTMQSFHGIAEWKGGMEWQTLGSGLDYAGRTLLVHAGSLFVGGDFGQAGDKVSHHVARWDDVITPVAIEAFQATVNGRTVELSWRLGAWWEGQEVAVERAESLEGPYRTLARLLPQESMLYTDLEPLADNASWYRLILEQRDGSALASPLLQVRFSEAVETVLLPPRVSQDQVIISYRIGQTGQSIALAIFDVRGQLVQALDTGYRDRGEYMRFWDGKTVAGGKVPRGVYLVRLRAGQLTRSHKVVITAR